MELDEEYPKTHRNLLPRLRSVLENAPGLNSEEREMIARAMNEMADHARDLDDITERLISEKHTPKEVGELLIAFELTTEQIRGYSDVIDGKLYEIADRLKAAASKQKRRVSPKSRIP